MLAVENKKKFWPLTAVICCVSAVLIQSALFIEREYIGTHSSESHHVKIDVQTTFLMHLQGFTKCKKAVD